MSTNTASSPSTNSNSSYFNTKCTGLAYINDVREVKPTGKGKPFLSVRLKVLQGPTAADQRDQQIPLYMNCNVFGDKLKTLLRPYVGDDKTQLRGLVAISDLQLSTYVSKKPEDSGTVKPCLYGRLFGIRKLWANGEEVFADKSQSGDEEEGSPQAAAG